MQFKACQYRCDPDGLPIKTDGWLNGGAEYSPCFGGGSVLTWSVAQPSERRSTTATATNAAIALIVFIFHSLSQPVKPLVECLSLESAPTFLQINLKFLPGNKNGTAKRIIDWQGFVSAVDSNGRTIWIADAHRDDGKRYIVRADEKLSAFLELETAIRAVRLPTRAVSVRP